MYLCGEETKDRTMANNNREGNQPAMAWLRVTDYIHGWLERELGGEVMAHGRRVVSLQHLPGAKAAFRMQAAEDTMEPVKVKDSMSVTRRNCIEAGMTLDAEATAELYGVTREELALFVPVECPKVCLTRLGVIRPWTWDVSFGRQQATKLQGIVREAFWTAVTDFDQEYVEEQGGRRYAAKEMIEAFCKETRTPSYHVDAIRREWQRRKKREK